MAQFILTCEHQASECDSLNQELEALGTPAVIKGRDFFCSCPYGHHGGWIAVEGDDPDAVLASLGPIFRAHAQVFRVESMRF